MGPFRRSHSIQKSSMARRNPRAADLTDEIRRASFEIPDDCPKKTLKLLSAPHLRHLRPARSPERLGIGLTNGRAPWLLFIGERV
jgi:hypothetical protein